MNKTDALERLSADLAKNRICTAYTGDYKCQELAVVTGVMGCVHEHIKNIAHCPQHVEMVKAGRFVCRDCRLTGHWCPGQVIYA